jgi:hypothetical protein
MVVVITNNNNTTTLKYRYCIKKDEGKSSLPLLKRIEIEKERMCEYVKKFE